MKFSVTVGAYKLFEFVELNVCRCRVIFGDDVDICIDDDLSENSPTIQEISEQYGCGYVCGEKPRGHFAGDAQTIATALAFGQQTKSDVSLKLSQRVIPVLPRFRECIEEAFANPAIQIVVPGRIKMNQIARPSARFFASFGLLTDLVAFRTGAITPEEWIEFYRERFQKSTNHADSLIEVTVGHLIATKFKDAAMVLEELANYKPFAPKIFLRKSQCLEREYQQLADMHGIKGSWNILDWAQIEKQNYFCRPVQV